METTSLISVDDYVSGAIETPEEWYCDYEYVDGEIEERFLGELNHASWQRALQLWFEEHRLEWNIHARIELRVQVSPTRFRVPDVTVWSRDSPREQILRTPPVAVFEVLSPEDRISRILVKLEDYARMGIATVRVIDPARDLVYEYKNGGLDLVTEAIELVPGSVGNLNWIRIRQLLED